LTARRIFWKFYSILLVAVALCAGVFVFIPNRFSRLLAVAIVAAFAAYLVALVSRRISHSSSNMKSGLVRLAHGRITHPISPSDCSEFPDLANTLNQTAQELDRKIQTLVREKNEQQAILSSMVEGVMAIDVNGHIISINEATESLIGVTEDEARGRPFQEVIRSIDLYEFAKQSLEAEDTVDGEMILKNGEDRIIQLRGTVLHDINGQKLGVLVVMHDMTRLRRLEKARSDFVANVSHELKTPITSIKGFVETLQDGALNDEANASRFLDIIRKHSDRLNAIIDDLLTLSRLELEDRKTEVTLNDVKLKDTLQSAISLCSSRVQNKRIDVTLRVPPGLVARVNRALIEHAVSNLLDNAVKYSPEGSAINLTARQDDSETTICVLDHGAGIPAKHLPRIFERFYRVDKARSRKLGGTGLGLAIVKHIAQVHQGSVSVESRPGEGSAFTIHLPRINDGF